MPRAIRAFCDEHKDIILKPLFGNGGAGVFRVRPGDENFNSLLEMFSQRSREPVIAQRYLPEVRKGDKRIILIDGKPVGVINRVPAEGEARSNMHVGGVAVKDTLSKRDKELCEIIGPELARRGLLFVGIDVIGDYLTEINVTSPTGLQQINRFDGVSLEAQIWDRIEVRFQETRGRRHDPSGISGPGARRTGGNGVGAGSVRRSNPSSRRCARATRRRCARRCSRARTPTRSTRRVSRS